MFNINYSFFDKFYELGFYIFATKNVLKLLNLLTLIDTIKNNLIILFDIL